MDLLYRFELINYDFSFQQRGSRVKKVGLQLTSMVKINCSTFMTGETEVVNKISVMKYPSFDLSNLLMPDMLDQPISSLKRNQTRG